MKITLEQIKKIGKGEIKSYTEEEALEEAKLYGLFLAHVHNQTPEICLAAVKKGYALPFVKKQTPEICLAAVQADGFSLQHVREQTPEICLAAVQRKGYALQYVTEQTPEICLAAVKEKPYSIRVVNPHIFKEEEKQTITLELTNEQIIKLKELLK
jgi:hypothetical protein